MRISSGSCRGGATSVGAVGGRPPSAISGSSTRSAEQSVRLAPVTRSPSRVRQRSRLPVTRRRQPRQTAASCASATRLLRAKRWAEGLLAFEARPFSNSTRRPPASATLVSGPDGAARGNARLQRSPAKRAIGDGPLCLVHTPSRLRASFNSPRRSSRWRSRYAPGSVRRQLLGRARAISRDGVAGRRQSRGWTGRPPGTVRRRLARRATCVDRP